MPQENPLDEMMHAMKKLLQQLEEKADKIMSQEVPFESEKRLEEWQKSAQALLKEIEGTVKGTGISPQLIREMGEEIPPVLTPDERETLRRMKKLREEIEAQRNRYRAKVAECSVEELVEEEKPKASLSSTRKGSRKSKFKRIGGDDWRPV